MLMELMRGIGIFYYWTWFIWPFVFVLSLVNGLSAKIKGEEKADRSILVAAAALLIILAGITAPNFNMN